MAKATKSKKKPIDQYNHKGKRRVNTAMQTGDSAHHGMAS
jgi:hypothetical protein